jgi:hypothetical protein
MNWLSNLIFQNCFIIGETIIHLILVLLILKEELIIIKTFLLLYVN